ncbi:hypothetical protein SBA4_160008 [Candidatus Sulfopaludibacter sp. SbA4]|nr:hypothetical protein SBA4_160008 [Candidatus Sulfopaludibacter sp. SbA4]
MAPFHLTPLAADSAHDGLFGACLRRPASLVGGKAQIPAGDDDYTVLHKHILTPLTGRRLPKKPVLAIKAGPPSGRWSAQRLLTRAAP